MDLGRRHRWARLALASLAAACGGSEGVPESTDAPRAEATPWEVTAFPNLPEVMLDVPPERIELGRLLFYDPLLSVDHETACATCHSELWGMGDGIARGVGHGAGLDAGPRREGPNTLRRNSSALYNLAFRDSLLWDGSEATLEDQAIVPLFKEDEMNVDEATLLAELESVPEYVERFADSFPADPRITLDHLASALAAFQRTIVSNKSTYDAYAAGRYELMSEDEVEGMFRFAEFGCDGCHVPPLFESEIFADRRVPPIEGVVDRGREEHTGLREDRRRFRTPSLRNLADTEPYFHNGSVKLMSDAITHELAQSGLPFTQDDARLIGRFVDKTLRDQSKHPVRPVSVPSGLRIPIDPAGPTGGR